MPCKSPAGPNFESRIFLNGGGGGLTKDIKFESTGTTPDQAPGPRLAFCEPNVRLLGSCWAQHEQPNVKGIYYRAQCWAKR